MSGTVPRPGTTRAPAYIGISGVSSPAQQQHLLGEFATAQLTGTRTLLLGVKATHKTQWLDTVNKYGPDWFPVGAAAFAGALEQDESSLRVAQVYLEPTLVHEATYRDGFTARLLERGRPWLNGIQFDMLPWQHSSWAAHYLAELRAAGIRVLLQCHGPAMNELGPSGCARRLGELADGVDYVLFDASHGTGTHLDTVALGRFLRAAAVEPRLDHVGLAVAGGLDAATVTASLPALLAGTTELSWDAEGRLHPGEPGTARPIDLGQSRRYLRASRAVLDAAGAAEIAEATEIAEVAGGPHRAAATA